MTALAAAIAAIVMPLTVSGHVTGELTPNRLVTVTARTVPGATCSLADALSGLRLGRTTSSTGRATWRWRPALWANGPDTVSVRCAKGTAQRSTQYFLLLGGNEETAVIRDYALHLVYWGAMPDGLASTVGQMEADVKASLDAGATDNPFAIPRAYGDSAGGGDPRIASIDATVDTDPVPRPTQGYCPSVSTSCLGQPDLANEVTRIGLEHGWSADNRSLIIVFTPSSTTVCYTRAPCTPSAEVCGYHALAYAGFAYAEIVLSATRCGADRLAAAIHTVEHEQDEAIVDPWGYGLEVGDPCENQTASIPINGHSYLLQSILDNGACAFGYTP